MVLVLRVKWCDGILFCCCNWLPSGLLSSLLLRNDFHIAYFSSMIYFHCIWKVWAWQGLGWTGLWAEQTEWLLWKLSAGHNLREGSHTCSLPSRTPPSSILHALRKGRGRQQRNKKWETLGTWEKGMGISEEGKGMEGRFQPTLVFCKILIKGRLGTTNIGSQTAL